MILPVTLAPVVAQGGLLAAHRRAPPHRRRSNRIGATGRLVSARPADCLIAATARVHGLTLITSDTGIRKSGAVRTLW
jgi:predicted nucleic acid-binding protein